MFSGYFMFSLSNRKGTCPVLLQAVHDFAVEDLLVTPTDMLLAEPSATERSTSFTALDRHCRRRKR